MCIRKTRLWGSESCFQEYQNETLPGYCPPVWDSFLCWPPSPPRNYTYLPCPRVKGNDVTKFAFRFCSENGTWAQRPGSQEINPRGWTNYSVCFNPYVQDFMKKIQGSQANLSVNEFQIKHTIAESSRTLEMVGLILSMISLLVSLFIFYRFRNLQNSRTRIHKNLFIAMSIQVAIRLVVYIDQYVGKASSAFYTIETTKYTCEAAYILLEYARTAMFLWMFVEGLYLHNMITVAVFQERFSIAVYYIIGWGFPTVLVLVWGTLTYKAFYGFVCFWGYNLSGVFWVLEGPRLLVIGLNLLFLLNIIRVLVTKLRESNSSEAQQVRKAVKAAIVLLPLLGITNSIQMVHSPVDKNIIQFAIWSYVTTFLTSFQGFFCALIYCFLNGEVQLSVKRFLKTRKHQAIINRRNGEKPSGASDILQQDPVGAENRDEVIPHESASPLHGVALLPDFVEKKATTSRIVKRKNKAPEEVEDPFFEHWSEGELSSHNNVDQIDIEIPLEYFNREGRKAFFQSHDQSSPSSRA